MQIIGFVYIVLISFIVYLIVNAVVRMKIIRSGYFLKINKDLIRVINVFKDRFLSVFIQTYYTLKYSITILTRYLMGRPFFSAIILISFFAILWHILRPVSVGLYIKSFTGFFIKIGIPHPNDIQTLDIVTSVFSLFAFVLGAAIPFLYFTYQQQKASSSIHIVSKNSTLLYFAFFSSFTLLFGFLLKRILITYGHKSDLFVSVEDFKRIVLWIYAAVLSIYFGYQVVQYLLNSINIKYMTNHLILKTKQLFESLSAIRFRNLREKMYKEITVHIESIYQLLATTIEKNVDHVFQQSYKEWMNLLADIFMSQRLRFVGKLIYECFLDDDPILFQNLYKSIFDKHITLILTCYKNQKVEFGHQCVSSLIDLNPREDKLRSIFLKSIQELANLLFSNDFGGLRRILTGLEIISAENRLVEKNGIIMIYKYLLIKAIEKDDIKLLSVIANSLAKSIDDTSQVNNKTSNKLAMQLMEQHIGHWARKDDESDRSCVYVLLQSILKSVELSHHRCVGYLIKFLVTTYRPELIRDTFTDFISNGAIQNPYLGQRDLYAAIDVSFSFNMNTLDYCISKTSILIFGHQTYLSGNKIIIGYEQVDSIDLTGLEVEYSDYLFRSISESKSKYGLWFLSDEEFMKNLRIRVGEIFALT